MSPDILAPAARTAAQADVPPIQMDATPKHLALLDRRVWRNAALAWLAQHLFFLVPIYLNIALAPPRPVTLQRIGLPWLNWDGWIYVDIAQHGYTALGQAAFFPLYPLVTRLVAFFLGGHTALAALVVANAASFGAFGLLLLLVESEFGAIAARRTLLFLLCFPASFFLAAAYTEALFLLLSLGAFLALRRHAWLAAGVLIALASLTRPVGILLLLPLAAELLLPHAFWRARSNGGSAGRAQQAAPLHRQTGGRPPDAPTQAEGMGPSALRSRASYASGGAWRDASNTAFGKGRCLSIVAAFLLPILALAGYCGYLALRFGQPLGFLTAEGGTWGRRASLPWDSFVRAGAAVLHDPLNQALPAALDLLLMALFIAVAFLALRRLPFPYALYTLASLALIVLLPMHRENWGALSSNKRFMVDVFPLFLVLGTARPRRWIEPLAVTLSLLLQVLLTVAFLQRGWVA